MYTFLIVLLAIASVLLIAAILLQSGKGGGLASTFGGASSQADAIFGTRQAGNLLTSASWWLGGIFLGLAFTLTLMSTRQRIPTSVLDKSFQAPKPVSAPAPTPANGGATKAATPAAGVPLSPATPSADSKAPASKTP